ncbi:MAG: hypothetical protein LCH62_10240 [Proteobacteria bacterium]|nr:hypothetical protein [Pseudomonadota bacterium]
MKKMTQNISLTKSTLKIIILSLKNLNRNLMIKKKTIKENLTDSLKTCTNFNTAASTLPYSNVVVTNVNGGGGTISGLTINVNSSGGSVARAVFIADGVTGVNILNNSITATQGGNVQAQAIAFGNNTSGTLRGNTVTATGTGSASGTRALVATNTTTITAANNSFSASGAASAANDVLVLSGAGATFTAGSTGNTRGNGLCSGTSASGAVSFTNGTSCP